MSELYQQGCEACRADAVSVNRDEARVLMAQIPEWKMVEEEGILKLSRVYRFKNFAEALAFTNRVGVMAEQQGHHPDILTRWGSVSLTWWSHSIKGLHKNDFICAARSDKLYHL
jgi:4a-hydroxytetrahydrobiopterin dehydratase